MRALKILRLGSEQLRIYTLWGDCGPDQVGMRNRLAKRFLHVLRMIFGFPCLTHQDSLAECRLVAHADSLYKQWGHTVSFYSSVVKLSNLFRQKPELCRRAGALCGVEAETKRKAPKCDTGRWGAIGQCERYFLRIGDHGVKDVLNIVHFNIPDWLDGARGAMDGDAARDHLQNRLDQQSSQACAVQRAAVLVLKLYGLVSQNPLIHLMTPHCLIVWHFFSTKFRESLFRGPELVDAACSFV